MESITPPKSVAQIFEEYRAYLTNIGNDSAMRANTAAILTLAHVINSNNNTISCDLGAIATNLRPTPATPQPT